VVPWLSSIDQKASTSAVKRARWKSLLVVDKEREKKERGSKKKLYQENNVVCRK
jgi:hypothetical protein